MGVLMRARQVAFVAMPDGSELLVGPGHLYADDDPIVADHPGLFEAADSGPRKPPVFSAADEPAEAADVVDELQAPAGDEDDAPPADPPGPDQTDAKPGTRRGRQSKES